MSLTETYLEIDLSAQKLRLMRAHVVQQEWLVSTAAHGPGELKDSGCTPRGWHEIRALIGQDASLGSVFVGRRPTGEIYDTALGLAEPHRDWILSRILWLSGLELGHNRLGQHDTFQRYIYIHGTPDTEPMGVAQSHGCIRMRNSDVIALFEQCFYKMRVHIG